MFIDFRERGKEREVQRETSMWERNSDHLPPKHALIVNKVGTRNLGNVPWPEIKPTASGCMGWRSNHLSYQPDESIFFI